jgi:ribosomal protein L7/L12
MGNAWKTTFAACSHCACNVQTTSVYRCSCCGRIRCEVCRGDDYEDCPASEQSEYHSWKCLGSIGSPEIAENAAPVSTDETPTFDVILNEIGVRKIGVIQEILEAFDGMGLADAKALVEAAPRVIKTKVSQREAEWIKNRIEAVGGKVEIKSHR